MNMTEFYHRVYSIMKYMSITFAITESRFQRSVELSLVEFFGLGFFVALVNQVSYDDDGL